MFKELIEKLGESLGERGMYLAAGIDGAEVDRADFRAGRADGWQPGFHDYC
ncbi:MAG: hypothetical protein FD174_4249 [Geobacteraceae bacterium]|nr:MAG: hypothetical protein FD174_4249 [Geobacteraceae bacterium]